MKATTIERGFEIPILTASELQIRWNRVIDTKYCQKEGTTPPNSIFDYGKAKAIHTLFSTKDND